MKIKAKNLNLKSTKIIVPFDGLIDIDANGETEVSDNAADILVNGTSDWDFVSGAAKEVNPVNEAKNVANEIKTMSIEEMKAIAIAGEYPEVEWTKFANKPKLMAGYLIKKFNEMQAAEPEDKEEPEAGV